MILIRITLNDGKVFFINENRKGIVLANNSQDAYRYRTTLEFKVTWKLMYVMEEPKYCSKDPSFKKENVSKFEFIDDYTFSVNEFDVNEVEIEVGKDFYVDENTFKRLIKCGITCSHWLYDKDNNWISYFLESDYNRVAKIRDYNRGLMHTITSQENWLRRYDEHSWHGSYELHHKCMLNPIIQQICILSLDSCHEFTVYEKKLN